MQHLMTEDLMMYGASLILCLIVIVHLWRESRRNKRRKQYIDRLTHFSPLDLKKMGNENDERLR